MCSFFLKSIGMMKTIRAAFRPLERYRTNVMFTVELITYAPERE